MLQRMRGINVDPVEQARVIVRACIARDRCMQHDHVAARTPWTPLDAVALVLGVLAPLSVVAWFVAGH